MQLIGEFKLSDEDREMVWTAIYLWFFSLLMTMFMNYWLGKDKNERLYQQLKAEVLRELNDRKKN